MNIAFFDTSSKNVGWCIGEGHATPFCWAFGMPRYGRDYGGMLDEFDKQVRHLLDTYKPDFVAYEAPILGRHDKLHELRLLLPLGAHIEFLCQPSRYAIPCEELDLRHVKSALTGDAHATKADMVRAAVGAGMSLPKTKEDGREDAADAFGGWVHMQRLKDPGSMANWDRRLGMGGALI